MDVGLYLRLSALMFMEYAIWGAWMPVLAVRLLGPLKMSGRQTGWIYATFPLACIFAPLLSGYLADKWFNAEWILLIGHALGAVLLLVAASQKRFWGMFAAMGAYSICYTATLPLVNQILFRHFPEANWPWVFLWAPVAWALVGYFLTGLRQYRKSGGDTNDFFYLAAILSLLMLVVCWFQLPTEPNSAGNPMQAAMKMLSNGDYLIFILAQLAVSGMMQFYFLGTGQFMQDKGISGRNVSAAMGIAQAVQAAATILLLGWLIKIAGYQWTFVIGALCWSALFLIYMTGRSALWIVIFQAFHGLAYVFFMIAGQTFVGAVAPKAIVASATSLIFIATNGVGLFLGTQLAGYIMERNSSGGKFHWQKIWAVPLGITVAGALALALLFTVPKAADFQQDVPPQKPAVAAPAK
jgi:MFS family permease